MESAKNPMNLSYGNITKRPKAWLSGRNIINLNRENFSNNNFIDKG